MTIGQRFERKHHVLGVGTLTDEIEVTKISQTQFSALKLVTVKPVRKGYGGGSSVLPWRAVMENIASGRWTPKND